MTKYFKINKIIDYTLGINQKYIRKDSELYYHIFSIMCLIVIILRYIENRSLKMMNYIYISIYIIIHLSIHFLVYKYYIKPIYINHVKGNIINLVLMFILIILYIIYFISKKLPKDMIDYILYLIFILLALIIIPLLYILLSYFINRDDIHYYFKNSKINIYLLLSTITFILLSGVVWLEVYIYNKI